MSYAPLPLVPGPVSLYPEVLAALHADYGSADLEPAFPGLYAATSRALPTRSPSSSADSARANRIDVSRSAATSATGARVIAHRATP